MYPVPSVRVSIGVGEDGPSFGVDVCRFQVGQVEVHTAVVLHLGVKSVHGIATGTRDYPVSAVLEQPGVTAKGRGGDLDAHRRRTRIT